MQRARRGGECPSAALCAIALYTTTIMASVYTACPSAKALHVLHSLLGLMRFHFWVVKVHFYIFFRERFIRRFWFLRARPRRPGPARGRAHKFKKKSTIKD